MSIQWTVIAGYLYVEIAIVMILILPICSPRRWNQFFKSRIFSLFQEHAAAYFYVLLGVLSLFLIDAIREMRKYSNSEPGAHTHLTSEMKGSVKLFRAQRNFYITGFAIFLAFVIRRLVSMIIIQDELTKKADMIIQQAEAALEMAKQREEKAKQMKDAPLTLENNYLAQDYEDKLDETEILLSETRKKTRKLEREIDKFKQLSIDVSGSTFEGMRG